MITGLTAEQRALLPTATDVAAYREHGYWISPVLIPDDVIDAAERGMQRYYDADYDCDPTVFAGDWTGGDGLRKNDCASRCIAELAALVSYPLIGASAAVLAGAPQIRLWHDQLLYKPVDRADTPANVGWHTDRQYWLSCSSQDMLTAWVGFHDVDEHNGSVSFLEGSHHWDVADLDFFDQDLGTAESGLRRQAPSMTKRSITMRRGQVSFHHCRTVHGSGPNRSEQARRSLAIHLQPGGNRWQRHLLPDGSEATHRLDEVVRRRNGVPDYADPRFCPTLWQTPTS